jgi:hypothetical protein
MKYEKLELEDFPPKQKMHLIQNAVGEVTELAYVKQIGDQDVAQGNPPLTYKSYMELLLNACSTYDKKRSLPGKQKHAVYSTALLTVIQIIHMTLTMISPMKHTRLTLTFPTFWWTHLQPIDSEIESPGMNGRSYHKERGTGCLKSADKNGWQTIAMGTQNSFLLLVVPTCMRLKSLLTLIA